MIVTHGRPFRRLRPLPAQGQAGLCLQPARSEAVSAGKAASAVAMAWRCAQARQAHDRVRLQIRRPRLRQGRHRRAHGRRQGVSPARRSPHTIPFLMAIDESFDIGSRYPHGGGRQLQAAVPLHRQDRQADVQAWPVADDERRAEAHTARARKSEGLARIQSDLRASFHRMPADRTASQK